MSCPVDFRARAVDFRARSVDFGAHPVDFMSVLSANALSLTLGVTHFVNCRYGKTAKNRSATCDQKGAF